jgi:hypothetical protein
MANIDGWVIAVPVAIRQGIEHHARTAALALMLAGCATNHHLSVPRPEVIETEHTAKAKARAGGVSETYAVAAECTDTNRIATVRVRTSFWQSLASVLTLGLWQRADIHYRCGKADTDIIDIPR